MRLNPAALVLAGLLILVFPQTGFGGGGGENLLMLVNPDSEYALRIANAYARLRAVPDKNIVFIAPPTAIGYPVFSVDPPQFTASYINVLTATLSSRGIGNQIDYIATFGQPQVVNGGYLTAGHERASTVISLTYALALMTQLQRGMTVGQSTGYPSLGKDRGAYYRPSELFQLMPSRFSGSDIDHAPTLLYFHGTNTAIHHSTHYPIERGNIAPPGYNYAQWYMAANTGNAGMFALSTSQVIANLQYTATGDGKKPAGKVYFENCGGVRCETRRPYWASVQKYMNANGISWVEEKGWPGTPKNCNDVRGAVFGGAGLMLPNGSTYLPGSYADNLTSNGGCYGTNAQSKDDKMLQTGAGCTAGTISEPYAVQTRFTLATVFIYSNDGSTLGEAHFKAIAIPDYDMLEGDMLSQAYADVPRVAFTSAPADYATVSGKVSLSASAALVPPLTTTATAIDHLDLFVDGLAAGTERGPSATFHLDTTTLSDGVHEIRAVAYNNSAAQPQGYVLSHIVVSNMGKSIAATKSNYDLAWNQTLPILLNVESGKGRVCGIQLQCLGRTVASVSGSSDTMTLTASTLAFGENVIIPVAIFPSSDVHGRPFTVTRDFHQLPGAPATPPDQCTPGFKYDFFPAIAGKTIATTNFSGTPAVSLTDTILNIDPPKSVNMPDAFRYSPSNTNAGLAVRITTKMLVTTAGEYSFWFTSGASWDSLQFSIDGFPVLAHECWNGVKYDSPGFTPLDTTQSIYLAPGEHTVQALLANNQGSKDARHGSFSFWYRGPDGVSRQPTTTDKTADVKFYTTP